MTEQPESATLNCSLVRMTAPRPGAIAILQLHGNVAPLLAAITGRAEEDWPVGRMRLSRFDEIDEGLAVRLADEAAQIMPHGGPRVMQRLAARLVELGAAPVTEPARPGSVPPEALYPEAADRSEALMLHALSRAASPLAIDALLPQPAVWRSGVQITDEDRQRSARLSRLLDPPLIVLAGPPNVGKSTLSNALLGRSMSIAIDLPGTTRDYTAAHIEMAGLVVRWHDTPGLRKTDDPIEARAIELSRRLMEAADLLIAMTDAEHDWPAAPGALPREPDLRIAGKADITLRDDAALNVSAVTGAGIAEMVSAVHNALVPPGDLAAARQRPWAFDKRLLSLECRD